MVVSGVRDPDIEAYLEDFPVAETGGDYQLGRIVEIPAGANAVSIYAYPPNDLSGGRMAIEDARTFKTRFGQESDLKHEKPLNYFARTHPGEAPSGWLADGWEENRFLDFPIHLAPLSENVTPPAFEADGGLAWVSKAGNLSGRHPALETYSHRSEPRIFFAPRLC
jgi:hypothetical protein